MVVFAVSSFAYATDYMSIEDAQHAMLPNQALTKLDIKLDASVLGQMEDRSGVHEPFDENRIWRTPGGQYFIVDEVIGKHEKIKYAVTLDSSGAVRQVEVLTYRESYGGEIRRSDWLSQFLGKTSKDPVRLGSDIQGISGATLSSKHIAQGIKRILVLYELALSKQ